MTGISTRIERLVTEIRHSVTRYRIRLFCFRAEYQSGDCNGDDPFEWIPMHRLPDLPLSVTGRKFAGLLTES